MKELIQIPITAPQYCVDAGVTFAQVDAWYGHVTRDLKMDIIYPEQEKKISPCIIWICGGAWLQMDRSAHLAYLAGLARNGFVVASVEYRTSNETTFPGQLQDIKAAIRYLRAHATRYCINSAKFGVMGESAGGHLSAMVGLTGDITDFDKGQYLMHSSAVQAACPWYLPSDISQMPKGDITTRASAPESLLLGKNATTHEAEAIAACPIHYVSEKAPPFLLLHGTADTTVPYSQSTLLYDALTAKGTDVHLVGIEGAEHADLHFFQQPLWDRIAAFFKEKLQA